MGFIENMSVGKLSKRLSAGFIIVIMMILGIGVVTNLSVQHLRADWNEFRLVQPKNQLITDMYEAIGYGGAIHQFKNYVLRQDAPRIAKIEKGFSRAQEVIQEYGAMQISSAEKQALADISGVFSQYLNALPVITKMTKQGKGGTEIDKVVKIDDSPAVNGMKLLREEVQKLMKNEAEHVELETAVIERDSLYGTIGTTVLLVIMLIVFMMAMRSILAQIGGEPKRIMQIAQRIADGDLTEELVSEKDRPSIFSAVSAMQKDLRLRSKEDSENAAVNERLRQALHNASSAVMVADTNNDIVFVNKSIDALFRARQTAIRQTLPHFNADEIINTSIDVFQKHPAKQKVQGTTSDNESILDFGECVVKQIVSPVVMSCGKRTGTIVEWFDITEQRKSEAEIKRLVEAATLGKLHERIDTGSAEGFYRGLSESMNDLMEVNERAVSEVQAVFASIADGDLTVSVKSGYHGMYKQLKDNANATVQRLTSVISRLKDSSLIIAAASTQLVSTNKGLTDTAEDGARQAGIAAGAASKVMQNVTAVADATTGMEQSSQEITRNVGEAANVASQAVSLAQSTNTQVRKLTTSSNDIGNVIKVINSIAEQTNLLALNATIEAARAGDAGKGFAVVANEVKDLAKGTASATDEIAQKVKAIQNDSDTAVQAIGDITEIIETISNYQTTISEKVEEQNVATRQISENANEAARGNDEITYTSKRVSDGIQSTVSGVSQVQASAEELGVMANELTDIVESFTIDQH